MGHHIKALVEQYSKINQFLYVWNVIWLKFSTNEMNRSTNFIFDVNMVTCWERLTSWLSFVVSNCEFITFPLVSWVRCGTWLYRFLIFEPLLTLINIRFCQRYIMQIQKFLMRLRSSFGLLIRNNSKNLGCYISKVSVICNIKITNIWWWDMFKWTAYVKSEYYQEIPQ